MLAVLVNVLLAGAAPPAATYIHPHAVGANATAPPSSTAPLFAAAAAGFSKLAVASVTAATVVEG